MCSENSLGMVVINFSTYTYWSLVTKLAFSGLKQIILDQTRQNGYQTVAFGVYIYA